MPPLAAIYSGCNSISFTFDVSVVNLLLLGWLSSGTSYALCMLVSDGGFQHEYRVNGNVDAKVETKTSRKVLQG